MNESHEVEHAPTAVRTVVFSNDWCVLGSKSFVFSPEHPAPATPFKWHVHNMQVFEELGLVRADSDPHILTMGEFEGPVTAEIIAEIKAAYAANTIRRTEHFHFGARNPSDYLAPEQPEGTFTFHVKNDGTAVFRSNPSVLQDQPCTGNGSTSSAAAPSPTSGPTSMCAPEPSEPPPAS